MEQVIHAWSLTRRPGSRQERGGQAGGCLTVQVSTKSFSLGITLPSSSNGKKSFPGCSNNQKQSLSCRDLLGQMHCGKQSSKTITLNCNSCFQMLIKGKSMSLGKRNSRQLLKPPDPFSIRWWALTIVWRWENSRSVR